MRALPAALVAALALAAVAGAAVTPSAGPTALFGGLDARQANVNPADVQIAVGPTSVVQAVNSSIGIYSRTGQQLRQQTLGQFFSGGGVDRSRDSTTDPRVLWDPQSGRFFASMFDITRLEIVVALSLTADPRGPWALFPQDRTGCTDQPRLGTSDTLVILTDDLFSSCRGFGRFLGGEVVVLSKQDMLNGVATPRRAHFGPDQRFAAVTPAQSLTPSATAYLVAVSENARALQLIPVSDTNVTSLPFKEVALAGELTDPQEAPQRGSSEPVDAGDNRIQNAVFEAGHLWAAAGVGCGAARDCARVVEIDVGRARTIRESTISLPNGRSLLYPAVAPDGRGNVVVGFSFTSPGEFPGFGYTYLRPDGQVAPPADLLAGTAPQGSGRFGDYSGAARDPSDPSQVWLSAQIGQASTGSPLEWGTGVGSVSAPPQAPAVVSTAASGTKVTAMVYAEGLPTTVALELGATRSYGTRTQAVSVPATARAQPATLALPATLPPGAQLHARFVATNSIGTSFGNDVVVQAPAAAPRVAYPAPAAVSSSTGTTFRARVTASGAPTTVVFQYGPTRAYGLRTNARRVGGSARNAAVSVRVRLRPGRLYHFRAVVRNAKGTATASDRTVRT